MSTTTKPTPSAKKAASTVGRVLDDLEAVNQAAEEILFGLEPDDPLTMAQVKILRQAGIDGPSAIEVERARVRNAKELMAAAGTNAERDQADIALINATRAAKEQLPTLEEQLEKIQGRIATLTEARESAQGNARRLSEARERLRFDGILPRFIRENYQQDRTAIDQLFHKRLSELKVKLRLADDLTRIVAQSQGAVLHAQAAAPELIVPGTGQPGSGKVARVDEKAWSLYVARKQEERPAVEYQLREVEAERDAEYSAYDKLLDFYVDQLP